MPLLRLHIGCFDQPADGWVNTDVTPHLLIARVPGLATLLYFTGVLPERRYQQHRAGIFKRVRYMNATRRFPFPSNTLDAVFSLHVLEHLYPDDARKCLSEAHRTLRLGGVCRIGVPDLDHMIAAYDPERADEWVLGVFESTRKRDKNRHHWLYNERSLGALLRDVGFREVRRCEFRQGRCPDLDRIDGRAHGTLFMEGVK